MAKNFRLTKFSLDKIFTDWPLAKILRKFFLQFDDRKATPTLGVCTITRENAMMATEFSV